MPIRGMKKPLKKYATSRKRPLFRSKKVCRLCAEKIRHIDYKDMGVLQRYTTERGKIIPSRISGNCAFHQRQVTQGVKKARIMSLLPFVGE
ncbi:MAG: 30S ribosomal protein S18 [Candidatus Omnitrophica bacterium]|nr:30S ribosomal protein S18 [Candidatus Omnitrophota bacterium]